LVIESVDKGKVIMDGEQMEAVAVYYKDEITMP
jgi:hypothetical protein